MFHTCDSIISYIYFICIRRYDFLASTRTLTPPLHVSHSYPTEENTEYYILSIAFYLGLANLGPAVLYTFCNIRSRARLFFLFSGSFLSAGVVLNSTPQHQQNTKCSGTRKNLSQLRQYFCPLYPGLCLSTNLQYPLHLLINYSTHIH
jgi:hypothetical protein